MTKIERAALLECLAAVESMSALLSNNCSIEVVYDRMAVISNSVHGLVVALNNESAGGPSVEIKEC